MCGICGLAFPDNQQADLDLLKRMNTALQHRGPDSDGFFQSPGVGLAMRRLAIIDLSTGNQPISNEDGTIWIVFNGEIFNFTHLQRQLDESGYCFKTKSDTECILHLYEDFGDECVLHLNGQFAFAIWDTTRKRLLLARDRLGEKPLFYSIVDGNLYFSSELNSLHKGLPQRPEINLPSIDLFLSLQYIPDPMTAFSGVNKLPPAHTLTWQNGHMELKRYWQLEYKPKWELPKALLEEILREKLREAVKIRMLADVPLGAHLSGGIDSSIIVALMAEMSSHPIETFSVGFEEQSFSELPYARAVAERYATHQHEFILSFKEIPATLKHLAVHFGEPFADSSALPLYLLSKITRPHVTVALNGDGGDDIFAGYMRYGLDLWANAFLRLPRLFTSHFVPAVVRLIPDRSNRPVGNSLFNGLKRLEQITCIDVRASILRWGSYFSPDQRQSLWLPEFWKEAQAHNAEEWLVARYEEISGAGPLDRTLHCDVNTYLPGDLLVKADRMSMAASLETRSPFLDHELVEWVARLPENLKLRGRQGKYLLRRAFADYLPEKVLRHRKQGFSIPVGTWFRGSLADWSRQTLVGGDSPLQNWFDIQQIRMWLDEHQTGRVDHGKRIWALVMLSLWLEG